MKVFLLDVLNEKEELKRCVHIYPHHMKGEGHFLALLLKTGSPAQTSSFKTGQGVMPEEAADFLQHCSYDFSEGYFISRKINFII